MTEKEIKKICEKHIGVLKQSTENEGLPDLLRIGAYQQQLAVMRLYADLLVQYKEQD